MSGGGFQVVLSDLVGMARVFRDGSAVFEAIMPADGPSWRQQLRLWCQSWR